MELEITDRVSRTKKNPIGNRNHQEIKKNVRNHVKTQVKKNEHTPTSPLLYVLLMFRLASMVYGKL